jgi:hypothetical protein
MADTHNRRQVTLTNCTQCGPRFTIPADPAATGRTRRWRRSRCARRAARI